MMKIHKHIAVIMLLIYLFISFGDMVKCVSCLGDNCHVSEVSLLNQNCERFHGAFPKASDRFFSRDMQTSNMDHHCSCSDISLSKCSIDEHFVSNQGLFYQKQFIKLGNFAYNDNISDEIITEDILSLPPPAVNMTILSIRTVVQLI